MGVGGELNIRPPLKDLAMDRPFAVAPPFAVQQFPFEAGELKIVGVEHLAERDAVAFEPEPPLFGIAHRDVKPENLMLNDGTQLKVMDFGIAVSKAGSANYQEMGGSPAYLAPEVFKGDEAFSGKLADIWSLGMCLYAMLCGMVPFKGRSITDLRDCII